MAKLMALRRKLAVRGFKNPFNNINEYFQWQKRNKGKVPVQDSMKILINRRQQDRGALNPFENLNAYWSWQDQHEETGMGNLRMANSSRSADDEPVAANMYNHDMPYVRDKVYNALVTGCSQVQSLIKVVDVI